MEATIIRKIMHRFNKLNSMGTNTKPEMMIVVMLNNSKVTY